MYTGDSRGAQRGACHGGETEARGCNPSGTQPFIAVRLRCFHTHRAEAPRSPVMAGERLILRCPGAVHCCAVPQFTWKMG